MKSAAAVSAASPPGICCESQVQKSLEAGGPPPCNSGYRG